jgi:hypothetical protein
MLHQRQAGVLTYVPAISRLSCYLLRRALRIQGVNHECSLFCHEPSWSAH